MEYALMKVVCLAWVILKFGRNVLIFGVYENSVIHSNNKANNIFIMGDGFVQDFVRLCTLKKYIVKILLQ